MNEKKYTVEYFTGIVVEVKRTKKSVNLSIFNSRNKEVIRLRLSKYLNLQSRELIKNFGDLAEEVMISKRYLFKFFEKGNHIINFEEIEKETRKDYSPIEENVEELENFEKELSFDNEHSLEEDLEMEIED